MNGFLDLSKGMFNQPGFLDLSAKGIQFFQPRNTWTPKKLFTAGEAGAWYDPSDISTLFMDAAGTVPVTADGDPVGMMKDKSGNGNHATQTLSASRPTYRTDGVKKWLQGDGVDDYLVISSSLINVATSVIMVASVKLLSVGNYPAIFGTTPSSYSLNILMETTTLKPRVNVRTSVNSFMSALSPISLNQPYTFTEAWNRTSGLATLSQNKVEIARLTNTGGDLTSIIAHEIFRTGVNSTCWPGNFYGGVIIGGLPLINKAEDFLSKKAGVTL